MSALGAQYLETVSDYIIWYSRERSTVKFRRLYLEKTAEGDQAWSWVELPGLFRVSCG